MGKRGKEESYGLMALGQARKLKELMNKLESTTIGTLASQISTLQNQVSTLQDTLNAVQNTLNTHTHSYTDKYINDTADGTGIEIEDTKTTERLS